MVNIFIKYPKLTTKQQHYIECLAIDLGLDTHRRNAHISAILEKEIHFLDQLMVTEASMVIEKFKEWKEGQQNAQP